VYTKKESGGPKQESESPKGLRNRPKKEKKASQKRKIMNEKRRTRSKPGQGTRQERRRAGKVKPGRTASKRTFVQAQGLRAVSYHVVAWRVRGNASGLRGGQGGKQDRVAVINGSNSGGGGIRRRNGGDGPVACW